MHEDVDVSNITLTRSARALEGPKLEEHLFLELLASVLDLV